MIGFPFTVFIQKKYFGNLSAGVEGEAALQLPNHACGQYLMQRNEPSFELNLGYT